MPVTSLKRIRALPKGWAGISKLWLADACAIDGSDGCAAAGRIPAKANDAAVTATLTPQFIFTPPTL